MKKVGIVFGVLALVFLFCVFSIWFVVIREAPLLDATIAVPYELKAGEAVEMVVTTSNPHARAVKLDSIDIDHAFLDGFQVVGVDPAAKGTENIPFINQRSWAFGESVAPGDELEVTFKLRAVRAGHFVGNVDVCNPQQDYKSLYADVVVLEE